MSIGSLKELLKDQKITSSFSGMNQRNSKEKRYKVTMRGVNVGSYSTNGLLNSCARKFSISKLETAAKFEQGFDSDFSMGENIDFAFGRAVETGIHGIFLDKSPEQIFFDMFLAWDIPLFAEHQKGYPKGFTDALIAIDRFKMIRQMLFSGWEVAIFNGKPAIELAMCLDMENGFFYVGHIDVILYNKSENRYRILEIKTTGSNYLHEAMYKNSDQAVGYSIMLDNVARDEEATRSFEIFYLVFSTHLDDWKLFQFTKGRSMRADWINTILQDNSMLDMYIKTGHFPKRGKECFAFRRPCQYLDVCDLSKESFRSSGQFDFMTAEELQDDEEHQFDFRFKLSQILETQQELL